METQTFRYYEVIETQEFNKDFTWQGMNFNQYVITFRNIAGTFLINRKDDLEQALIGGKLQFNLNESGNQVSRYRIIGYEEYQQTQTNQNERSR
jgi:hypothetical protein